MKIVQIRKVFSGAYFPVFRLNTGKDEPEKTSYLGTFHVVKDCTHSPIQYRASSETCVLNLHN